MEKKTMGSFLSALRKANGMTQQDVADRLGVTNRAVSRWERDEALPDITLLPALAEMFGVTCDELLKGEKCFENATNQFPSSGKIDKQRKAMLNNSLIEFKNKIVLSVIIGHIGGAMMLCFMYVLFKNNVVGPMICLSALLIALYFGITALIRLNNLISNEESLDLEDALILHPFKTARNRAIRILIIMTAFLLVSVFCCLFGDDGTVFLAGLGAELVVFGLSEWFCKTKERMISTTSVSMILLDAVQLLIFVFICLFPALDGAIGHSYTELIEGKRFCLFIFAVCLVVSTIIGFLFVKFSKTYKKKVKFITIRNMILTAVGIGWVYTFDFNYIYNGRIGWLSTPSLTPLSWLLLPFIIAGTVIVTIMWNKKHSWEM